MRGTRSGVTTRMMVARIVLVALGLIVWGYGVRIDHPRLRLIGIALLATSLVLRFFKRREPPGSDSARV